MKRKIVVLSVLLALTAFAISLTNTKKVTEVTANEWSTFVEGEHDFGDSYQIPTMTYNVDGVDYPSTCITTFPDNTQSASSTIELDQAGQYILEYSVSVNGVIHNITKSINVDYKLLHVGDKTKSSLRYINSEDIKSYGADTPGFYVQLGFGDVLNFTKPFYLDQMDGVTHLIKGYVVPLTKGSCDFGQLFFKLTDADNPEKYVTLCYYSHTETNGNGSSSHSSSVMAKSDAQPYFAGLHQTQGLHTNDTYGLWSGVCFDAYNYEKPGYKDAADAALFTFGFNYITKEIYGTGFGKGASLDKVLDLDSPDSVDIPWAGFTSNRAFLSIYCESYSSTTANFVITELAGVDPHDFADNIFIDNFAPDITVDSEYEDLPNGAVGYYYPIPEATAYDQISLGCEVKTEVYYNYFSDDKVNVQITNNSFLMDKIGIYTIVYTASDKSGNMATATKTISVFENMPKPDFELPLHHITSAHVGEFVKIDREVELTSSVGNALLNIYYVVDDVKTLVDSDGFRITELKDYEIIYEAKDLIGQVTSKSFSISVTDGGLPILEKPIVFPRYFISRGYYDFPKEKVFFYENGHLVEKELVLEVTDDNGTRTYKNQEYSPIVDTNGHLVNINVKCDNHILQSEQIYTIKNLGTAIRANAINLPNYFIEDGMEKELLSNGIQFSSMNAGNSSVDFANRLLNIDFNLTVTSLLNFDMESAFVVRLTDASNPSLSVEMKITNIDGDTYFVVDNNKTIVVNDELNKTTNSYSITFDGHSFGCESYSFKVQKYVNGAPFTGFESNMAYLTIYLENSNDNTSFILKDICQCVFSNTVARDRISPVIFAGSSYGGTKVINSYYTIKPAYSFDVLSPNITFTLDVVGPDGQYMKATDGTSLQGADPTKEYNILLDKYGQYYFTLTSIEDARFLESGSPQVIGYYIRVYDDVAPTVTFNSGMPSEAKVGDIIQIPTFTCSDNITPADQLIIQRIVLNPNGVYQYLKDTDTAYKVSVAGEYRFIFHVIDIAGNFTTKTFIVVVSK